MKPKTYKKSDIYVGFRFLSGGNEYKVTSVNPGKIQQINREGKVPFDYDVNTIVYYLNSGTFRIIDEKIKSFYKIY